MPNSGRKHRRVRPQQRELERLRTDFGYVFRLPKHTQLFIAFYEYARHSQHIVRLVQKLREYAFGHAQDFQKFWSIINSQSGILRTALPFLVTFTEFPDHPIHADGAHISEAVGRNLLLERFECVPLSLEESATLAGRSNFETSSIWPAHPDPRRVFAICIPWNLTNAEITSAFGELVKLIRPCDWPQPERAGRKGRAGGVQVTDMLRQLAAFRMEQQGLSFDDQGDPKLYLSLAGWKKAVKAARTRIFNIERGVLAG